MIPRAYIDEWRSIAPWQKDFQVEQDLVISLALVQIFSHELLREHPAFRGGTALHKLFLDSRHVIRRKLTWYIYITPKQSHRVSIRFQSFGFSDPEGWGIKPPYH